MTLPEDVLYGAGGVALALVLVLVILEGVHGHLPRPLVRLVVDTRPVQHLDILLAVA